ncbi:hypothetical protein [Nannocystis pusilla]|uniref:hypothetical protein n=1 Tax=Nannocystis pusilla TaxID=889268 RepID=UPI003B7CCBD7
MTRGHALEGMSPRTSHLSPRSRPGDLAALLRSPGHLPSGHFTAPGTLAGSAYHLPSLPWYSGNAVDMPYFENSEV